MSNGLARSAKLSPAELKDDVIVVLLADESGSMNDVKEVTCNSINEYVGELQSGSSINFSLGTFSSTVEWLVTEESVDAVLPLDPSQYAPNGTTCLYDAIGEAIDRIENMGVPPVYPVVVVFTDGKDFGSLRYSSETLGPVIAECRGRGWRFIAFIVGDEARGSIESVGFLEGDVAEYDGDDKSTKAAFKKLAASTKRFVEAVEMKALPSARFL